MDYSISIIIPVFNKFNFTKSCLDDLFKLPDTHQIIIIDNASVDETQSLSLVNKPNFNYIRNNENVFHSKACNQGYSYARGKYVIFLNNDIRIKSDYTNWTDKLINYCDDNIVGPTMGVLDHKYNFIKEANQQLTGNSYLSGWCLASSKDNWNKLDINNNGQIFDENFPFYFNDTNLGFMCRKLNIPMKVADIPVVHFGKISASQLNVHKLYTEARKVFINKWSKK